MAGVQARKEEEKKKESHKQTIHKVLFDLICFIFVCVDLGFGCEAMHMTACISEGRLTCVL